MFNFTHEQQKAFDFLVGNQKNILINADPGSGKTAWIVETCKRLPKDSKICIISFIKEITIEITNKVVMANLGNVEVKTLNALGYALCKEYVGNLNRKYQFPNDKNDVLFKQQLGFFEKGKSKVEIAKMFSKMGDMKTLLDVSRLRMETSHQEMVAIVELLQLKLDNEDIQTVRTVLELSNKQFLTHRLADFTDQIYQSAISNHNFNKYYDYIFVDESNDLSLAAIYMLKKIAKRIVFVGDKKQAIMSFAGSNPNSMDIIAEMFDCECFEFTKTFRNPINHCNYINERFSESKMNSDKENGLIEDLHYQEMLNNVNNGDVILGRSYKGLGKDIKLIQVFFDLLSLRKQPFCLKYNPIPDIEEIFKEIFRLRIEEKIPFIEAIDLYFQNQLDDASKYNSSELLMLRRSTLAFWNFINPTNEADFFAKLIGLKNSEKKDCIVLSSIHSAKGMEWENVYVLNPSSFPYKRKNQTETQLQEEINLWFVALSRSKKNMFLVTN